jgi:hypothetical protein
MTTFLFANLEARPKAIQKLFRSAFNFVLRYKVLEHGSACCEPAVKSESCLNVRERGLLYELSNRVVFATE